MKQFYAYLTRFIREDFNPGYYLSVAVFTALAIGFNYAVDLEDGILDALPTTLQRYIAFMCLYLATYGIVLLIHKRFYPNAKFLTNRWLWLKLFIGFSLLSFDTAVNIYFLFTDFPYDLYFYVPKVLNNLLTTIAYILPLYVFSRLYDNQNSFYGLTKTGFEFKPYIQLFALVVPLVGLASFHENFNTYYPIYPDNAAASYWGVSPLVTAGVYELAYAWSFVSIEVLFRGFFVIGFVKIMGRHAIIPMAITYAFIHFGKPIGECISAVFGGYLLGVIAFYSRNIWGGIIIHVGLALLMELFAYLQQ